MTLAIKALGVVLLAMLGGALVGCQQAYPERACATAAKASVEAMIFNATYNVINRNETLGRLADAAGLRKQVDELRRSHFIQIRMPVLDQFDDTTRRVACSVEVRFHPTPSDHDPKLVVTTQDIAAVSPPNALFEPNGGLPLSFTVSPSAYGKGYVVGVVDGDGQPEVDAILAIAIARERVAGHTAP